MRKVCPLCLTFIGKQGYLRQLFPSWNMRIPSSLNPQVETEIFEPLDKTKKPGLLSRMAAGTRGQIGKLLITAGTIAGANSIEAPKAEGATIITEGEFVNNTSELPPDAFTFDFDGGWFYFSNADDLNGSNAYWMGMRNNTTNIAADAMLSFPNSTPQPDAIINPDNVPDNTTYSDEILLTGMLQNRETFWSVIDVDDLTGDFGISSGAFASGADVYIGTAPLDGMPQDIDEAIAMTQGEVIHAIMPSIAPEDAIILRTFEATQNADFNQDGFVNAADYTVWRDNLGSTSATSLSGDADGDLDVDGNDFLVWQQQFGTVPSSVESASVPEPGSGTILVLGAAGMIALASRKRFKQAAK